MLTGIERSHTAVPLGIYEMLAVTAGSMFFDRRRYMKESIVWALQKNWQKHFWIDQPRGCEKPPGC
jgi:hypothetical protein